VPSQNVTGALLSAALAFFITWLVKFFFGLVFAPAELFFEKKSQNDALRSEITNLLNSDAAIEQLSKFYHEGKLKYQEYDNFSDWKLKMKEWTQEVEKFISANFSVSELHEFRKSGSGFEYKTEWNWVDIEHNKAWAAKASAWRRIQALDDMVRGSSYAYMPHKNRLKELLGETRE